MSFTTDFQRRNVIEPVRLAAYTTMRIGGPATLVTLAVTRVLEQGVRTPDIATAGATTVGTREMAAAVIAALQ